MSFRIRNVLNGSVINFIDDDDGSRMDQIEDQLKDVLHVKSVKRIDSETEEYRLLGGKFGDFVLRWDGYMTDLLIKKSKYNPVEIFNILEKSGKFSL